MIESRTCHSPCQKPPLDGKDELARGSLRASIKSNNTPTFSPAVFWAATLALALALALAPPSTNELFKQFMKTYLEFNQELSQPSIECKQSLKAKIPNVYYGKLHIDCYYFC